MKFFKPILFSFIALAATAISYAQNDSVVIKPTEFEKALNNPLKGFRPGLSTAKSGNHLFSSVVRMYLKWNELERSENDDIEKIISVCNQKWSGAAEKNIKIIPRVYLDWDSKQGNEYWPSDMTGGDYTSDEFEQRLSRLVRRLGKVWDNDPRVAWIQMGIIGYWGEHHHPKPNEWQQKLLGDLFTQAFKNKKVLVRYPHEHFHGYNFGFYWDRFGDTKPGVKQAIEFMKLFPDRWKTAPNEGEVGYGADYRDAHPGEDPDDSLTDPSHRAYLVNWIRKLHATGCGWISNYNLNNPAAVAGAEELQKVFGYRFVLKEVIYPKTIQNNQRFSVSLTVENEGSAPFYYDWPVELRLLEPVSYEVKWGRIFNSVDIRDWMPGEQWNEDNQQYDVPAPVVRNTGNFNISDSLPKGKYILALAILDPAGMEPSVKFATSQYLNGGNHPIGYVGIDTIIQQSILDPSVFDDPLKDNSLRYKVVNTGQTSFGDINRKIPGVIEAEKFLYGNSTTNLINAKMKP